MRVCSSSLKHHSSHLGSSHTFGGVQHDPFPNIVPELNDPSNLESVAHFDTTNLHFDNNVATEYISGTTQNPLVVGFNDTTNSDKRTFGSDGKMLLCNHSSTRLPSLRRHALHCSRACLIRSQWSSAQRRYHSNAS
ncbi:hypothetical protein C8F04DRAFT_75564 [Mycena alexandri]|uniref:Uncharacterized protein n=1 Tax=Mycena alexandri TaxID=1745969 RepID=A0AAD6XBY0_9AGAR|nr:hypothetical protein C8F04DRAFT_75564 [Mycena alexandri]